MNVLALFTLFTVISLSNCSLHEIKGELYITVLNHEPVHKGIKVFAGKLYMDSKCSSFEFGPSGTLRIANSKTYVFVNEIGRLSLRDRPTHGFSLNSGTGSKQYSKKLAFEDMPVFQLCRDNSIAFKSFCTGARPITIAFEYKKSEEAKLAGLNNL